MNTRLQIVLLAIVAPVVALNIVWSRAGHFDIEVSGFAALTLVGCALACGGIYYEYIRREERLAAMLFCTAFLVVMSNSFSLFNNLLLTIAGTRADNSLAAIDRAIGVNWPAMMAIAADHQIVNAVLKIAYESMLPQIAVLVVALGIWGKSEQTYAFCIAVATGATICIVTFTIMPSFGAFSVYALPLHVTSRLNVLLDARYAQDLIGMLAHGPGRISVASLKGLIGFPSYHAVLALLVVWYARELSVIRWLALGLNTIVLISTPIQGGHHVVDILAGVAVTAAAVWVASRTLAWARRVPLIFAPPQTALT